jgi:tetratricopeptide (TPR) repeat protein
MARPRIPHVDDPVQVGRRIREAREQAGLRQIDLAFPGCTPAYISRVESGARVPSLQLLHQLARRLDVTADYLAWGREEGLAPLAEAELALSLGELDRARELFASIAAEDGDDEARGRALGGLGELKYRAAELDDAVDLLEEARAALGASVVGHPGIVESLGKAYAIQGRFESCVQVFESALAHAREQEAEAAVARFAVLLANALIDSGLFERAAELLGEALARAEGSHDPIEHARLLWSQSRLHALQRRTDLAADLARRALALVELTENAYYAARAHQLLAFVELERGNAAEALALLERGLPVVQRSGNRFEEALFRVEESRARLQLGDLEGARTTAAEVAGVLTGMSHVDSVRAYAVLADVFAELGERKRAIELYEMAAELLGTSTSTFTSRTLTRLAELLEADGRKDEAFETLKRAVAIQDRAPTTS